MSSFVKLQDYARRILVENFDAKLAKDVFGLDKSNFYAYRAGTKTIPMHVVCGVIDYTGAKLVVSYLGHYSTL